jgi:asparagine synthase (glutamine-hydrolysing)
MCGISGIISLTHEPVNEQVLRAMSDTLVHRGPDDSGLWVNNQKDVGFSHRRLSIIDLGGSPQPMLSSDQSLCVCFNGEIFNYEELRTAWSFDYATKGDTETLLAGYTHEPDTFVHKLRGQFAFAIRDEQRGETHLYRDRLGVLPLFYVQTNEFVAFASEVKALLPVLNHMPDVDKKSVSDYLAQRGVPAPNTLYNGINKLEPGHHLTVTKDNVVTITPWYEIPQPSCRSSLTYEQATDKLETLLLESVESALVADVPVGAYLSGGIDSSLICAMIAQIRPDQKLSTFSARFSDGSSLDETPYARRVAELLDTDHHEITVTPQDFIETWPTLTYHFDAPIPEPPDIAFSFLAKLAREHVTVVLSGEGSDELFAGYPKYQYAQLVDHVRSLPYALRGPSLGLAQKALPASMNRQRTLIRAAQARDEFESFRTWFAPFTQGERKEIFDHEGNTRLREIHDQAHGDVVQRMSYQDLHGWLADNILERGDRTSMMHSLELRPPFLDVNVLEFARSLPSEFLVSRSTGKKIVRDVAKRYLPQEIFERPKHGFKVPLDDWFRGHLKEFAYDHLTQDGSLSRELFDSKFVHRLLDDHMAGKYNDGMRIYTLVALEMWWKHRATI